MPEGPEIRRIADKLERAIVGQALRGVFFAFDHLKPYEALLAPARVQRLETRGKALLTHFDNAHSVYSHNQLYGRWYIVKAGQPAKTTRSLRFALYGTQADLLLYSASDIDVLARESVDAHPFLAKLGPDALDPALTVATVAARLSDPRRARRRLADLLLDQSFIAGLGNYLRSEILYESGLQPARKAGSLDAEQIAALASATLEITRRSYTTAGLTQDLRRCAALKLAGVSFQRRRHAVFAREGLPCYRCSTPIQRIEMNRRVYWCTQCQV